MVAVDHLCISSWRSFSSLGQHRGPVVHGTIAGRVAWGDLLSGSFFGGALAGGVLQTLVSHDGVLIGASGAVCALLVGFATLLPRLEITALIFFIIPVRMKASTLGWLVIAGSFLFWLFGIEKGIGHLAHLGGGVAGFVICRIYQACGLVRPTELINPRPSDT